MKKVIFILLALVLIACLVGCESETSEKIEKTTLPMENDNRISIWIDEETGVQYIIYQYSWGYGGLGGITPRLNADGTLYGCAKGGK